jgi:hypothetical protein
LKSAVAVNEMKISPGPLAVLLLAVLTTVLALLAPGK